MTTIILIWLAFNFGFAIGCVWFAAHDRYRVASEDVRGIEGRS